MMRTSRDERECQIDMRGAQISYGILSVGILLATLLRSLRGEAPFDLLALVVVSGLAGQVYVARSGAYSRAFVAMVGVAFVIAFVVAVAIGRLA